MRVNSRIRICETEDNSDKLRKQEEQKQVKDLKTPKAISRPESQTVQRPTTA